ncbi:MAG: NUDIX hydrolase [Cyanobacteria bacterium REEB67]|nr:NUDIX hydrolase [Cyanobacteria bacterium REEB67]
MKDIDQEIFVAPATAVAQRVALPISSDSVRHWKTLSTDLVADCRVFSVHRQISSRVSHQGNDTHSFYIVRPSNWVNVIPITEDGKVVMIEQFRHGIGGVTLEVPGGMVDAEDGGSAVAAERELLEETGYQGRELYFLGCNHPNPALQPNICDTYLSVGAAHRQMTNFDSTEEIAIRLVPIKEIPELIANGQISHALVIVAFQYLQLFCLKNPSYAHLNPF